ncbi:MAG TPA: hypothetical protein PLD93_04145 [Synergistaceae bacterium]|nr:hypothetical protein [Synergistaceae bacterium]
MKILAIPLSIMALLLLGCAPPPQSQAGSMMEKKDDVYIPKDLDDCFVQLKKLLKPQDLEKMKSGTEDDMIQYHLGLGMWMRSNWGLWAGSRLAEWFNIQGITHPDDMSAIILDSFWRHLNKKPIELEEQVKYYQDYWKKQETIKTEH